MKKFWLMAVSLFFLGTVKAAQEPAIVVTPENPKWARIFSVEPNRVYEVTGMVAGAVKTELCLGDTPNCGAQTSDAADRTLHRFLVRTATRQTALVVVFRAPAGGQARLENFRIVPATAGKFDAIFLPYSKASNIAVKACYGVLLMALVLSFVWSVKRLRTVG